jgi:predicted ATPase
VPFIHDLPRHCTVYEVLSDVDYREQMILNELNKTHNARGLVNCLLSPYSAENKIRFDNYFSEYTGGKSVATISVEVMKGRKIDVTGAGRVARVTFDFLIKSNFGANDYRAISEYFSIIFIENVKTIDISDRNTAARFIIFVS